MTQVRQTIRKLLHVPAFTLTILLTLAIGIGATTAIFAVVNGILIKPLPFPESDRLIDLRLRRLGEPDGDLQASLAIYFTYRDNNESFESVALWTSNSASLTGVGDPDLVRTLDVTHEFIPTLGVSPALGRSFNPDDDQPGSAKTVILSYGHWQRLFGGAQSALGETLVLDGEPHAVIGVLPRDFRFLSQGPADVIRPMQPSRSSAFVGPAGHGGVARLRDGVTIQEASADVARMIPILYDAFPPIPGVVPDDLGWAPNLRLLKESIVGDLDDVLWMLMGAIGMLLLIACANVANLQLTRTEGRAHELTIKHALGANPGAIARSLLLESTLLGLAGGIIGLFIARLGMPALLSLSAEYLPNALEITIDWRVFAFALAISLVSGLAVGAIPALNKYAAPRVNTALHVGVRALGSSQERYRARNASVIVQVSLAVVLLIASGLMIRSFLALRNVDPGFAGPETVQTVHIEIPQASVPEFDEVARTFDSIQDSISAVAGVDSVAFITNLPLEGGPGGPLYLDSGPGSADTSPHTTQFRFVSPGLFEALGTPLVAGRDFERTDLSGGRPVGIVSEGMARALWGSPTAALGQRIRHAPMDPWNEIVGVVGDLRHHGLEQPAPDTVYWTLGDWRAQFMSRDVSFVVRSDRVGTAGFLQDIQRTVWSVNSSLPLASVQTLKELYDQSMARTALILVLLTIAATMALGLGLLGIYAVVSYMLAQRVREIGVRMALGARNGQLRRMLLGQVLGIAAIGIVLGLGGAVGLTRLMKSLLFGVTELDPTTYAAVPALLLVVAAVAAYLPARRVTRIDPMAALRSE